MAEICDLYLVAAGLVVDDAQIIAPVFGLPEVDAVDDAAKPYRGAVGQLEDQRLGRTGLATANGQFEKDGKESALAEFGQQVVDQQTGQTAQTGEEVGRPG